MKMRCIRAGFGITLLFNLLLLSINAWGTPYIAFTSERDGDAEIYIMDTKGKNLQNLTNHPARDVQPAFSPDGQWMAYVSDRDGNSRIYLMNRNKNEIRPLTNHLASEADLVRIGRRMDSGLPLRSFKRAFQRLRITFTKSMSTAEPCSNLQTPNTTGIPRGRRMETELFSILVEKKDMTSMS